MSDKDIGLMAHLMRRAGWGAGRDELEERVAKGYEVTVEELIDPDRLNIYTPEGVFLTEFIGDAEHLSPWAQATIDVKPDFQKARRRADQTVEWRFKKPVAVNVDGEGRIMVLETGAPRIQIYVKERDFVDAQFNL